MTGSGPGLLDRARAGLDGRAAPVVVGALTALLVVWLWGSLDPVPWVYDEAAYLLQAKIFATFSWAAPGRPLPEFFEQIHVFVTPKLVPKYPPGHALLMVPGIWLGLPALMPVVMSGITGGLLFALARSIAADSLVAVVAWAVWITSPVELYIRSSYLSQSTTGLVWLGCWWLYLRWQADPRLRWLLLLSVVAAVGAITRPISMVPVAVALGVPLLGQLAKRRELGRIAAMVAIGLPILALAPLWSWRASGRAFPTPYSDYSRVYAPWNMPGFSVDSSPPLRPPFPALEKFRTEFLPQHEAHRVERIPAILADRVKWIAITFFGETGLRWILLPFGLLGLAILPRAARPVAVAGALLVLLYLWIASRSRWTVYYLEAMPVLALATAIGVRAVARWVAGLLKDRAGVADGLVVAGLLVAVPGTVTRLVRARQAQEDLRFVPADLAAKSAALPGKAIVFIRPGPPHRPYESYVRNEPDLDRARVWLVQDRGADNARLLQLAPDRAPYTFDPGTGAMTPWTPGVQ